MFGRALADGCAERVQLGQNVDSGPDTVPFAFRQDLEDPRLGESGQSTIRARIGGPGDALCGVRVEDWRIEQRGEQGLVRGVRARAGKFAPARG